MSHSRKFLIVVGCIVVSPLAIVVLWIGYALVHGTVLQLMGYPVDVPPYELAAQIAAKGGDPLRCRQLQQSVPTMGPSLAEKRMSCIYEVAKLTRDPTVCELLLPGEYGLSCIGVASEPKPCTLRPDRSVGGNGIYASLQECLNGPLHVQQNGCCAVARVSFLNGYDDCSPLADSLPMSDQCYGELAYKKLDASICANIRNDNLRSACTVRVSTLSEYPDLPSFAPINTHSD